MASLVQLNLICVFQLSKLNTQIHSENTLISGYGILNYK